MQQDLKTVTALGAYAATVITALTVQNTRGVKSVAPVSGAVLSAQLSALLEDMPVAAVKIGQIPNLEAAEAVFETLQPYLSAHPVPVVYDPVMISTSGHPLMAPDCIGYVAEKLFPCCRLVTPNLPETERLLGAPVTDAEAAGRLLAARYRTAFLIKGGHAEGGQSTDWLVDTDGSSYRYDAPRIDTPNLHGTGCTLSSAIATYLAQGQSLEAAVGRAKPFLTEAILRG